MAGIAMLEAGYGCVGEADVEDLIEDNVGEVSETLVDDDTDQPPACPSAPLCDSSRTVLTTPSLVVTRQTHASLLDTHFQLSAVLTRILEQSSVTNQDATNLYRRLWDTQNEDATGIFTEAFQPHCDDNAEEINGFPIECPRGESTLTSGVPSEFTPLAVFNRFDLAPQDGSHCGEYRIVYGRGGSTFVIFEAQLANPTPSCGIESCRPVAEFWRSLSTTTDPILLGNKLQSFYFTGLTGFRPVVHPMNYGLNSGNGGGYGASGGQIRTNSVLGGAWQLREFQLARNCTGSVCTLFENPVSVKNNPFGDLFDFLSTEPLAATFRSDFVAHSPTLTSQVERLSASTVVGIGMGIANTYNGGQSTPFDEEIDYTSQLDQGGANNPFIQSINLELQRVFGSTTPPLNAQNITERARTQSCGGCHQDMNGASLGNGLVWPSSLGFVHVSQSGALSPALNNHFLPHRKNVLEAFLQNCPPPTALNAPAPETGEAMSETESAAAVSDDGAPASDPVPTLGGSTTH